MYAHAGPAQFAEPPLRRNTAVGWTLWPCQAFREHAKSSADERLPKKDSLEAGPDLLVCE